MLRGLDHPGIVRVFDAGITPRIGWIAMELVRGTDLRRYTRVSKRLPDALIALVGMRLARALAHAHAAGVVHRDVKPANVLADWARDTIKLSDFGTAAIVGERSQTRSGAVVGSPEYMAHEQLAGAAVGPPADVYALGVTLFELFCGRRPYEATSLGDLLRAAAAAQPTPLSGLRPDLPPALDHLVMRTLAREPRKRPTAQALAAGLQPFALPPDSGAQPQR